ncbi:MAG: 30S ribosome-binding factor RbfA [Lachnospiraceae bacterium]|nr:30S ribosome-binding factor RbfA [Lachnospiraceae bacterium]MBQ2032369.1 30S ribosome-binding factor RbfA [Lachnospiraceae bacterium]
MKKNSTKNRIVSQEVRRELSRLILEEVKDPRIAQLTTVTDVYVAPDLKTAKVYVSVYGDEAVKKETFAGLRNAAPFLRSMLAKNLNMRHTPQLFFTADDSLEYGMRMDALIASVSAQNSDSDAEEDTEAEDDKTV